MKKYIYLSLFFCLTFLEANDSLLKADFRHREPHMVLTDSTMTGPLKTILEVMADRIGMKVKWRLAPFTRSVYELEKGASDTVDIIPRTVYTKERTKFLHYLGPIGYQIKKTRFIVRKKHRHTLKNYEDLYDFKIGLKSKTHYFARLNEDKKLNKIERILDLHLINYFSTGEIDVIVASDVPQMVKGLNKKGVEDFAFADYYDKQTTGIYFALGKSSKNAKHYQVMQKALMEMVDSGEIDQIYKKAGVMPLASSPEM